MNMDTGPELCGYVQVAQQGARRLGHRWIGGEHLLFAVCAGQDPTGMALRGIGLQPRTVWMLIQALAGVEEYAVDRDALAAIGIDLDHILAVAGDAGAGMGLPLERRGRRVKHRHLAPNAIATRCLAQASTAVFERDPLACGAALTLAVLDAGSHTVGHILGRAGISVTAVRGAIRAAG